MLGVRRVRSKTIRGATEISVLFNPSADMPYSLQLMQAKADEVKGEIPLGFIVLKAGVKRDRKVILQELVQMVREKIGPIASFKLAIIVSRLPKTRSGKILRGTLKKIADGEDYRIPAAAIGATQLGVGFTPNYFLVLSKTLDYGAIQYQKFRAHHRNRKLRGIRLHTGILRTGNAWEALVGTDIEINDHFVIYADWISGASNAVSLGGVFVIDQHLSLQAALLRGNDQDRLSGVIANVGGTALGDVALVPDPAYPIHNYGVVLAGANVITVPLGNDQKFLDTIAMVCEHLRRRSPGVLGAPRRRRPGGRLRPSGPRCGR